MNGQEWALVSAMLTIMTSEGVAIKMLFTRLDACQQSYIKSLERSLSMVKTAASELDPPGAQGPQGPQAPQGGKP